MTTESITCHNGRVCLSEDATKEKFFDISDSDITFTICGECLNNSRYVWRCDFCEHYMVHVMVMGGNHICVSCLYATDDEQKHWPIIKAYKETKEYAIEDEDKFKGLVISAIVLKGSQPHRYTLKEPQPQPRQTRSAYTKLPTMEPITEPWRLRYYF